MRAAPLLAGLAALLTAPPAQADRRVPIAVMELSPRGVDPAAASALATEVSNALADLRVFRVITKEDIKRMLQLEQTRQQCTGQADAACLAEIGGALGVEFLVYGEVSRLGGPFNLSLVLLDIGRAEAVSRARAQVAGASALLEETARATRALVQPLLTDKTGFLVVDVREPGAEVSVDGRLLGVTPLPGRLELPMGPHEVRVDKEGFLTWARSVDLEPGQATVASAALIPSPSFVSAYEGSARSVRTAAWLSAGAGAALLGTSLVLGLVADARFDDLERRGWLSARPQDCAVEARPGELCPTNIGFQNGVLNEVDDVETLDTLALGAAVLGGAAALGSAVLFFTGDDPDRYRAFTAVAMGPGGVRLRFDY